MNAWYTPLLESDRLPDSLIRKGIRRLLRQRLNEESAGGVEAQQVRLQAFVQQLRQSPIAIEAGARRRGIANLEIVTTDINTFETAERYDRVVSVEMFEHMRNYARLMENIHRWTKPNATLFVHVFAHRSFSYPFEVRDASDW